MSVPDGSSEGLFRGDNRRPRWARLDLGVVVAWCLTIAALLSIAALVCQVAVFSGIRITSRIIQFSLLARYQVALVVAAAVALSITSADTAEGARPSPVRRLADGALAVGAAAVLAANAYAVATFVSDGNLGKTEFSGVDATSRVGFTAVSVAGAVLGAVALHVIGCGGRATTRKSAADGAATGDSDHGAIELPSRDLLDPVVACIAVATVVLLAEAVTAVFAKPAQSFGLAGDFSRPDPSVGSRIASAANNFNAMPIAFAALAVVVLVPRSRRAPRDGFGEVGGGFAAIVGVVAVGAGAYGAWRGLQRSLGGGTLAWWARGSALGTALSSGALGAAAVYANRQRALTAGGEFAPVRTRFDPRVVGLGLAIAALGSAGYVVTPLIAGFGPGIASGEVLLLTGPYVLMIVGLAFAAVIVMASSRREPAEPTERDTTRNAVDVVAGAIALATLVAAVYVIVYVVGHKGSKPVAEFGLSPFSVLDQSDTAQKVGYVALALAYGIIATGALLLVWRLRRPPDDDDPGDEVPVVELVP
jgi:hypothetical protein